MIVDHTIKRGMTLPSWPITLTGGSGRDLVGATCTLNAADSLTGALKISGPLAIESAAARTVRYDFSASDTDDAGTVYGRWKDYDACVYVVYSDGKKERFPSQGFMTLRVAWALT